MDRLAAMLDSAMLGTQRLGGVSDPQILEMPDAERLARLIGLRDTYAGDAMLAFPGTFLAHGPSIDPAIRRGFGAFGVARDLSWPSGYVPWHPEVAELYARHRANHTAHARIWAGPPGPVVVVIHGYGAGHLGFEQLLWPVRAWRRRGFGVVLPVLPFHGRRAAPENRLKPVFPGYDPRFTHEGFRQSVHDLTALIGWLRASGHGPVGVVGMSLGGYLTALLATLLDDLAFAGMVIPLASVADFARSCGRLGAGDHACAMYDALEAVYSPSSPFARPPRIAAERVRILAARGDRITGPAHAERLGRHFGAEVVLCPGGHLLQLGLRWDVLEEWMVGAL